ncbi:ankyrin repeat domain-containing protein [Sphingomonas sp.]|uniref:ankyrin repeat domain-containing protein n=1 Tax=Sphingomonas sp. TaxID=28214 RepID=UPI002B94B502|nr:ankyrin repeat domain-containing protein [Sphingomonas sp.]HTG39850.1 ankyrin repeat domain-containing protein [Sphingomonas sp.]
MIRNFVPALLLGTLSVGAIALPMPASAQQFSESYKFLEAIRKEDGTKVNEILGAPGQTIINTRDRVNGEGALHIVTKRNDPVYLRFLLQKGANPNIGDSRGETPMLMAVASGFGEGIDILIRYKADVDAANSAGETPLIRAVQMRRFEMVRQLLKAGANPDKTDIVAGMSARDYAKRDARSPAIAKLLADAPAKSARRSTGPVLN